jgi:hypothetical protein
LLILDLLETLDSNADISLLERLTLFLPNPLGDMSDDLNFGSIHYGRNVPQPSPQGEEQSRQK